MRSPLPSIAAVPPPLLLLLLLALAALASATHESDIKGLHNMATLPGGARPRPSPA